MLKHIKKIVILMLFVIIILVAKFYLYSPNKEYLLNIFDAATFYEILETDGFVYFGSPNCPSCKLFKPLLTEVAKEENIQIYYLDTNYVVNNSIFTEDETIGIREEYQIDKIPMIIKIVNGLHDSSFGARFGEGQGAKIKEQIREFVTYGESPIEFIPQYTVIIVLFILSIVIAILRFLLNRNKTESKNALFIWPMLNISLIIILLLAIKPIMSYLDNNNLSSDPKIIILIILAIMINLAPLIRMIITYNKFKKIEDGSEISDLDTIIEN